MFIVIVAVGNMISQGINERESSRKFASKLKKKLHRFVILRILEI
jgi:hypothetical protein